MGEEHYEAAKTALLEYIQELFDEREQEILVSHQEKYAMLEDVLGNAVDLPELRVAFEQWHTEHSEEIDLDQEAHEMWQAALVEVTV